jgi:hypothetical protein
MREDYSDHVETGVRGKYAERIRREGIVITEHAHDGSSSSWYYPPGTLPNRRRVHVYSSGSHWYVRNEGASRAYRKFRSRDQAMELGLELAQKSQADLVVHAVRT